MVYEWEEVDKERFVKLYLAGLNPAAGLSKADLTVFELVYNQLHSKPGQDTINDLPLTYERTRGLRLSFLWRIGHASEPARCERPARLCAERIASLEAEFAREPGKVHRDWLREVS